MNHGNERPHTAIADASYASGVSWGAIFAGALGAAAISLILLVLGSGLGFASVSPWAGEGVGAEAIGVSAILWITFTSLAASALGGYLAGRLRVKWGGVNIDEVYFRDTAHGFLAWALATLLTASLLASAVTTAVGGGVKAGAAATSGIASAASQATQDMDFDSDSLTYFVDSLFRSENRSPDNDDDTPSADNDARKSEITHIVMNALRSGSLPERDADYIAQVISENTGIPQRAASERIQETYDDIVAFKENLEQELREAADEAAKAAAYTSLWVFISLLIGAFIASLAATFGGRQRDQ